MVLSDNVLDAGWFCQVSVLSTCRVTALFFYLGHQAFIPYVVLEGLSSPLDLPQPLLHYLANRGPHLLPSWTSLWHNLWSLGHRGCLYDSLCLQDLGELGTTGSSFS